MIDSKTGNIFESNAEALVNTVNTVGVMGKGIALQFKERYPENYFAYRKACKDGQIDVGAMFVTAVNQVEGPKWIINFPTKKHWKGKSEMSFVERGLDDLIQVIVEHGIQSIAIPPLGAGNGGLNWGDVKELINKKLASVNIEIQLYEPTFIAAPEVKSQNIGLTKSRALILELIKEYKELGFDVTHLEIQKLAYFLQRMGQFDLRLQYKKWTYGPFAYNLQHLLNHLEGSYIIGQTKIMDSKPLNNLYLIKEKTSEFRVYIEENATIVEKKRLEDVKCLIDGFESPFGLELLSTIDWIIDNKEAQIDDADGLYQAVLKWNDHKAKSIKKDHIDIAAKRLAKFSTSLYR